jgi:hypothetical protein
MGKDTLFPFETKSHDFASGFPHNSLKSENRKKKNEKDISNLIFSQKIHIYCQLCVLRHWGTWLNFSFTVVHM